MANVVGRGITVEPQVKLKNGELAKEINDQLVELWEEWIRFPEVTWECHWNHMLRLLARVRGAMQSLGEPERWY